MNTQMCKYKHVFFPKFMILRIISRRKASWKAEVFFSTLCCVSPKTNTELTKPSVNIH